GADEKATARVAGRVARKLAHEIGVDHPSGSGFLRRWDYLAAWFSPGTPDGEAASTAHDSQAPIRRIPPLLPQGQSEHRQASQPGYLRHARSGEEARTGGAVLQASLGDLPRAG